MRPILFHIGPIPIRAYGTLLVLGFLAGLWWAMRVCARRMQTEPEGSPRRIHPDHIYNIAMIGLVTGLIGARLLFVLLDWGSYAKNPLEALRLWEGGLSLHGAMIAAILTFVLYAKRKGLSILAVGDIGAQGWALAYAIGRIGCLLNGCCYGGACDLPWAVRFPDENNPGHLTPPSHPVQLYATLFNLVFFWILARWDKRPHRDGELFYGYIAMYGFYRFVVEAFRAGTTSTYLIPSLHLTDTHVISLVMIAVGLLGIAWLRRHRHPVPASSILPPAGVAKI